MAMELNVQDEKCSVALNAKKRRSYISCDSQLKNLLLLVYHPNAYENKGYIVIGNNKCEKSQLLGF